MIIVAEYTVLSYVNSIFHCILLEFLLLTGLNNLWMPSSNNKGNRYCSHSENETLEQRGGEREKSGYALKYSRPPCQQVFLINLSVFCDHVHISIRWCVSERMRTIPVNTSYFKNVHYTRSICLIIELLASECLSLLQGISLLIVKDRDVKEGVK